MGVWGLPAPLSLALGHLDTFPRCCSLYCVPGHVGGLASVCPQASLYLCLSCGGLIVPGETFSQIQT